MKKNTYIKLSVLSLAFISAGIYASDLVHTEVATPPSADEMRKATVQSYANNHSIPPRLTIPADGPALSFIIRFKEDADPDMVSKLSGNVGERGSLMQSRAQSLSQQTGESVDYVRSMGLPRTHVFRISDQVGRVQTMNSQRRAEQIMEALRNDPNVEMVEENRLYQPQVTPNDPQYSQQWHYYEATGGANTPGAWSQGITGQGVVVAVLDSGYRPHVDLAANILPGYDMISDPFIANDGDGRDSDARDPGDWVNAGACGGGQPVQSQPSSWHGTHVAGTIAAVTNNGQGVAGVAYDSRVVPVRVLGRCGGMTNDIADGILWAAGVNVPGVPANPNPASVINMSLGGMGGCQSTMQQAINTARNQGVTVIVASGNSNTNANNFSPGNCNGVINVASTNRGGSRAYYSNTGTSVTIAAPGGAQSFANDPEGVLSTYNTGTTTPAADSYRFSQGTSMAAPHVAGVAALVKQALPSATPNQVAQILTSTARSFPGTCNGCGAGIVDAGAAVALALGNGGGDGGDNGGGGSGSVSNLSAATNQWNRFTFEVPAGMSTLQVQISGGTGDADLYVRRGASPTLQAWDCRPYLNGNNEVCTINNPQSGTWYFGVHAYQAYSGVTLTASYQP